jgi:hypothetical protein
LICAGDRGLLRGSSAGFAPATNEGELSGQNVRAVMVDRDGSVWVGTSSDGLHRLSRRVLQYWSAMTSLKTTTVTSIAEDASGGWWIGAASQGVYRFEGGRFSQLEDPAVSAAVSPHLLHDDIGRRQHLGSRRGMSVSFPIRPADEGLSRSAHSGRSGSRLVRRWRRALAGHVLLDAAEV